MASSNTAAEATGSFGNVNAEAYEFLQDQSHSISKFDEAMASGTGNNAHGNGHGIGGVNGTTSAMVLFSVVMLLIVTVFLAVRVYK